MDGEIKQLADDLVKLTPEQGRELLEILSDNGIEPEDGAGVPAKPKCPHGSGEAKVAIPVGA